MTKWILILGLFVFAACNSEEQTDEPTVQTDQVENVNEPTDNTGDIPDGALFGVRAVKLVYEYSGEWTGRETAWIEDYGNFVVIEQDLTTTGNIHNIVRLIWDGEEATICNHMVDGKIVDRYTSMRLRPKDTELSLFAHGDETQLKYGYEEIDPRTIQGLEARGWKSKSADITGYVWKGIDLAYNNMGVIKELVGYEEIESIPDGIRNVPDRMEPAN